MTVRLSNPVPLEAAIQLRRHLLNIRQEADYFHTIAKTAVSINGMNVENSGISSTKTIQVNTLWDVDFCMDQDVQKRTNGLTEYHSKCMLYVYLFSNENDPAGMQGARARFHADFLRYFFPQEGQANTSGIKAPWTLPTEAGQKVIREFYVDALNYDADYQKKPIIKLDIGLTLYWATLRGDLHYPM